MSADIFVLASVGAARAEESRRRAMALHPSNFRAPELLQDVPGEKAKELSSQFERLHQDLVAQGLSDSQARTEAVRIVIREVWNGLASELRRHRAAGHQMDANVLAVALGSIQCVALPLARHPGDLVYACRAVSKARRRLQYNGGLLDRLQPHANPAFGDADLTLQVLEVFLAQPQSGAA